jgi:NAD+ synthase (glutamine-hydrolysing)
MNYGYITVASAIPQVRVADVDYNVEQIERFVVDADKRGVEILVFPELSVTGYSCQDLFAQQALLDRVEKKIADMLEATKRCDVISVVGAPICIGGGVYNCAVVCQHGKVLGIVPKRFLPNYGEFYEKRWFASSDDLTESVVIGYAGSWVSVSGEETLFKTARGVKFGIELCEDVWSPLPPSTDLVLSGADIILNLSASDDLIGKNAYLKSLLAQQSARLICGYVYSSCCGHVMEFNSAKSLGWYDNLSLTGKMHNVGWSHLIFDDRYSDIVDVYEGGYMHNRGVFRSEQNSCNNCSNQ